MNIMGWRVTVLGVVMSTLSACASGPAASGPATVASGPSPMIGLWEVSTKFRLEGEEERNMVATGPSCSRDGLSCNVCTTAKQLVPLDVEQRDPKCTMRQSASGSTVTWTSWCPVDGGGSVKGVGKVVYTGTTFTGTVSMTGTRIPKTGRMNGAGTRPPVTYTDMKGTMTLSGKHIGSSCDADVGPAMVVNQEPPQPQVEAVTERPGYIWVGGNWSWRGGRWAWIDGHWERQRAGYTWVPGKWDRRGNSWHWVAGSWAAAR